MLSRDGRFVAFLSDRDGRMDVWVSQIGTGQHYNLTRGTAPELVNASAGTLGFSPDGTLVTFGRAGPAARTHRISVCGQHRFWVGRHVPIWRGSRNSLVERRHSSRLSHPRTWRSDVCAGSRRRCAADLFGRARTSRAFSHLVPGSVLHLFRAGRPSGPHGRLAHQTVRRRSRARHES